jgi:hypothetical protein
MPCLQVERDYERRWNMNNLNREEIERFCQDWEIVGEMAIYQLFVVT